MGKEHAPKTEDYRRAFLFLTEYITDPSYELVGKHSSIVARHSVVGMELSILLRGGGKDLNTFRKTWTIEGKSKNTQVRGLFIPNKNEVQVVYAEKGTPDKIIDGFYLHIPVKTSDYCIYVSEKLPFLTFYKDGEAGNGYNPAARNYRDNHILQKGYAISLKQGVTALLDVFPNPRLNYY